jgi:hypothetical protein
MPHNPAVTKRLAAAGIFGLLLLVGCHRKETESSFTADINMSSTVPGMGTLSGKLYLGGSHLRADWGQFADVFDLRERKGWRIIPPHSYQDLVSKDLSTYAPEMTDGSPCPHAQVPSACKLVSTEVMNGREAKKWDIYSPSGFHVFFWTDKALGITLRMAIGDAASYEVKDLRGHTVSESLFELPAGYQKLDRSFRP